MMKTHRKEKNSIFWNRGITRLCFCWTTFGFVVLLDIGNESITPLLMLIFLDHCDSCTYILTSLLKIKRWKNENLRPKMWSRPRQPLLHSHNKNEAHVHFKKTPVFYRLSRNKPNTHDDSAFTLTFQTTSVQFRSHSFPSGFISHLSSYLPS